MVCCGNQLIALPPKQQTYVEEGVEDQQRGVIRQSIEARSDSKNSVVVLKEFSSDLIEV